MSMFKELDEPGKAFSGQWEVVKTIWSNQNNDWGIWSFRNLSDGELYKVTGAKPAEMNLENGTIVNMEGRVIVHPTYGASIRMSNIEVIQDIDEKEKYRKIEENAKKEAYRSFLIMRFRGIGEVWSKKLVDNYPIEQIENAFETGDEKLFSKIRMPQKLTKDSIKQYRNLKARVAPFTGVLDLMKLGMNNEEIIENVSLFAQTHRVEKETSVDYVFTHMSESRDIQDLISGLSLIDTVYSRSISEQKQSFSEKINSNINSLLNSNGLSFFQWMKSSMPSISISRIDKFWLAKGGAIDDYHRLYFISDNILKNRIMQTGSVGLDLESVVKSLHEHTGLTVKDSRKWVEHVSSEPKGFIMLSKDKSKVYYVPFVAKERRIAENLHSIMKQDTGIDEERAEQIVNEVIDEMNSQGRKIKLDEKQKEAVKSALINPVFILTGGPGCGKTFTLNIIIAALKKIGHKPDLMAPTGKAAKRAEEMTGIEGHTIHKKLKIDPLDDDILSMRAQGTLTGDVAIVDEVSMIDIPLTEALIQGVRTKQETSKLMPTRLIFVGDSDQLPSVGPGDVLRDMIDSDKIPHVKLTKVFRQGNDALGIIDNAQRINNGEMPQSAPEQGFEIKKVNGGDISEEIERLVIQEAIKSQKEGKEVLFLTPMRKKGAGVERLNIALKAVFNPRPENIVYVSARGLVDESDIAENEQIKVFSNGDKIIQTKNNYRLTHPDDEETRENLKNKRAVEEEKLIPVMNGETGEIVETREDGFSLVFNKGYEDEKHVFMDFKTAFKQLEHAWAITVHKSQGSQAEKVVVIMDNAHNYMLNKKIFYTAVTRAEKECVVIGNDDAIRTAVNNKNAIERETTLKENLNLVFEEKNNRLKEMPTMISA